MRTIDEELGRAGEEMRLAARRLPSRTWDQPRVQARSDSQARGALRLALVGMLVVLAGIGIPALWLQGSEPSPAGSSGPGPTLPTGPSSDEAPTLPAPPPDDGEFPHLGLTAAGWYPSRAFDQTDNVAGGRSTSVEYLQQTEDGSGGTITLSVQSEGLEGGLLAGLRSAGPAAEEQVTIGDHVATLFTFTDQLHALYWTVVPGFEAALSADGPTRDAVLALAESVEAISVETWLELTLAHPYTTITVVPSSENDPASG